MEGQGEARTLNKGKPATIEDANGDLCAIILVTGIHKLYTCIDRPFSKSNIELACAFNLVIPRVTTRGPICYFLIWTRAH